MAPPGFCNRGKVRYGSIGGLEYEVPQSRLYCLYQRGSLLDGLAMYLSCDTKKFRDNESTHILHNFWTSTHRGKLPPPPGGATAPPPGHKASSRHIEAGVGLTSPHADHCLWLTTLTRRTAPRTTAGAPRIIACKSAVRVRRTARQRLCPVTGDSLSPAVSRYGW